MKNISNPVTSNDSFKLWQKKAQQLFVQAKEEDMQRINDEYGDVLRQHTLKNSAIEAVIDRFSESLDHHPQELFSWEDTPDVMEAHMDAMLEMERIHDEFLEKWGARHQEYINIMAELERRYEKTMALTRSRTAYKEAMKNCSERERLEQLEQNGEESI